MRHLRPYLIVFAFVLVFASSAYALYAVDHQQRVNKYEACVRGNDFRDLLDVTFRGVIKAASPPRAPDNIRAALEARLSAPLESLQESKRECGDRP